MWNVLIEKSKQGAKRFTKIHNFLLVRIILLQNNSICSDLKGFQQWKCEYVSDNKVIVQVEST